jgi:uncharacterized protein (UPF0332 family)
MDSRLYILRAENEIKLAKIIFTISDEPIIQKETFEVKEPETYYSAVISHAYYSIFYAAKAYLLTKGMKTDAPEEHRKTFEEFKKLVEQGIVDVELLRIYEQMLIRADTLLHIFQLEKGKRGKFTYRTLPQANREPAKESIENAQNFFKHIYGLCEA